MLPHDSLPFLLFIPFVVIIVMTRGYLNLVVVLRIMVSMLGSIKDIKFSPLYHQVRFSTTESLPSLSFHLTRHFV